MIFQFLLAEIKPAYYITDVQLEEIAAGDS